MIERDGATYSCVCRKVLGTPGRPGRPVEILPEVIARRIPTAYADGRWDSHISSLPGNALYRFQNTNIEIIIETVDNEQHSDPRVYIDVKMRIPPDATSRQVIGAQATVDDITNRLMRLYEKTLESRDRALAVEEQDRQVP